MGIEQSQAAPVDIRLLTPDDAQAYKAMRIEAAADPQFGATIAVEEAFPVTALRQVLANKSQGFIMGAFAGERIIGMVGFGTAGGPARGTLFGLFVRETHRGNGIGRLLVRSLTKSVPSRIRVIELFVAADNGAAIGLYRSEGFDTRMQDGNVVKLQRQL